MYMAFARTIAVTLPIARFYDIRLVCEGLKISEAACRAGALKVGTAMLCGLGASLVIVALIAVYRVVGQKRAQLPSPIVTPFAVGIAIAVAALVCLAHVIHDFVLPIHLSRVENIGAAAGFISMENLVWPLLLQLAYTSQSLRLRFSSLLAALAIAALSPFRGVLFGLIAFGVVLPTVVSFISPSIAPAGGGSRTMKIFAVLFALLVGGGVLLQQTLSRRPDNANPRHAVAVENAIQQRAAIPLFQAYEAEVLSQSSTLPSLVDGLLKKLRIQGGPNLNEFLYRQSYGSRGVGETTSLYYGEAAANFHFNPIYWIVFAALTTASVSMILSRFGFDVGVLAGIALWRGSLGGFGDVLPAFVLQIVAVLGLSIVRARGSKSEEQLKDARDVQRPMSRWLHLASFIIIFLGSVLHAYHGWVLSRVYVASGYYRLTNGALEALRSCDEIGDVTARRLFAINEDIGNYIPLIELQQAESMLVIQVALKRADHDRVYRLFRDIGSDLMTHLSQCRTSDDSNESWAQISTEPALSCDEPTGTPVRFCYQEVTKAAAVPVGALDILVTVASLVGTLMLLPPRRKAFGNAPV
jgi:hypothetical protein